MKAKLVLDLASTHDPESVVELWPALVALSNEIILDDGHQLGIKLFQLGHH